MSPSFHVRSLPFSAANAYVVTYSRQLALIFLLLVMVGLAEPVVAQQRVAFVTSVRGDADLDTWPVDGLTGTGLAAADQICVKLAEDAGLENAANFVAWISDSADDAYCRIHNLTGKKADNCGQADLPASAGPWVRTDGKPFAPSVEFLVDNERVVYHPLSVDQNGDDIALEDAISLVRNEVVGLYRKALANITTASSYAQKGVDFRQSAEKTQVQEMLKILEQVRS